MEEKLGKARAEVNKFKTKVYDVIVEMGNLEKEIEENSLKIENLRAN